MKILIVEDEWKTLQGISNLIAEIGKEFELCGQARSGEEGLRLAMELHPDIIITDIRMNGMTGLEMIKKLNEEAFACRYIILSGYAEFQYAREAITLGSMDYLLKPITKEILEESLCKVKAAIEEEAQKIKTSAMKAEQILERALFMQGFSGSKFEEEWNKRFPSSETNFLLLIRGENRIVQTDWELILAELNRGLKGMELYVCREARNKENYVFLRSSEAEIEEKLRPVVRRCRDKVNPYLVFAGIHMQGIGEIKFKRERLIDMTNWNLSVSQPAVLTEESISRIETYKFSYPAELERKIINTIGSENTPRIEEYLNEFLGYLREKVYSYIDIREALICLTAAILYAIRKASYGLYENISNLNILEWVRDSLFLENYPQLIMNVLMQYEQYTKNLTSGNHPIINQVLKVMYKEYRNELPLDEMAQRMNVTPEYLSTLFMKELGIKYTTYRAQIRIDVAKRLLCEGKLKIYEVAEASGFPDVKYFTKVFKKYTGVSPGEYIRANGKI